MFHVFSSSHLRVTGVDLVFVFGEVAKVISCRVLLSASFPFVKRNLRGVRDCSNCKLGFIYKRISS
jgi:F0F1-type ATP synthase assembly protein I